MYEHLTEEDIKKLEKLTAKKGSDSLKKSIKEKLEVIKSNKIVTK